MSTERTTADQTPEPYLDEHDRKVLADRGVTLAVAAANRLQTVDSPNIVAKFLGCKEWQSGPVLAIPFFSPDGTPQKFGQLRPHKPRKGREGKLKKYEVPLGSETRPYFPADTRADVLADKSIPLVITESAIKVLALESHCYHAFGFNGVWNFGALREKDANGDKIGSMVLHADFDVIACEGRDIVIIYDSDAVKNQAVRAAENVLAKLLIERGAKVRVARLPNAANGDKQGVDDFLVASGKDALDSIIAVAEPPPPNTKPIVFVVADEYRTTRDVLECLGDDPDIYFRDGLVRLAVNDETDTASIRVIEPADVRCRITERCDLMQPPQMPGKAPRHIHPPDWLPPQVLGYTGPHGIRRLERISGVPIVRPNGTIHGKPGYDPVTRCYFHAGSLIVPTLGKPTRKAAEVSAKRLLDILADFPIQDDAGRSVWLSIVLSVVGRHLINGSVPGSLITSNIRGTGKGLAAECASLIATGASVPTQSLDADTTETRKMLSAVVMAGSPILCLDNIPSGSRFGSAVLDMVLTTGRHQDRLLGGNRLIDAPFHAVLVATGNNLVCAADAARRWMLITLDSLTATPENRTDFARPRLADHVRQNRGQYVADALTVLGAYLQAGKPDMDLGPTGSFVAWSDIIRSAIVWAGLADPWLAVATKQSHGDAESDEHVTLVRAWDELDLDCNGLTVAAAKKKYDAVKKPKNMDDYDPKAFPGVDELIADAGMKDFDAKRIGYLLRKHKGRPTPDGRRIERRDAHGGASAWRVAAIQSRRRGDDGGDGGHGGDASRVPTRESSSHRPTLNSGTGQRGCPPSPPSPPVSEHPVDVALREWNRMVGERARAKDGKATR